MIELEDNVIKERSTLLDELLREQLDLTAVERFSRLHEGHQIEPQSRRYQSLLPATAPAPGEQYAFEVDLDKCSGCKACVTACHSLNGLQENETWRNVGLLVTPSVDGDSRPGLQHVTTACHHCIDPGCLNGCPVLAYDKDPITGIVRHLDDQCIGCSYCVMKCPYDVPKFSKTLGIVRKCDLCSNRLAAGEAPACVQACPDEAIKITLVPTQAEEIDDELASWRGNGKNITPGGPAFPDASITQPATRFITRRPELAQMQAANAAELRPAPSHPPLSMMLVLTQLGVGVSVAAAVLDPGSALLAWLALGATGTGVAAATLHLGQPLKAWRSFMGWRKSWLSRELLAFGVVMGAMSLHALLLRFESVLVSALAGITAVICSAMIYVDTRRAFWSAGITFPKFILTSALLAAAGVLLYGAVAHNPGLAGSAAAALILFTLLKLGLELGFIARFARVDISSSAASAAVLGRSAQLQSRAFRNWVIARVVLGAAGGLALPGLILAGLPVPMLPVAIGALMLCFVGEGVERHLFFICEAAPRMPGGIVQ